MATDKQKEEARSRKPRHRRNHQMEEFPTFTKWLTSFGHSSSTHDANSKSNLLTANRPFLKTPVTVLDSSQHAAPLVADLPPKEDRVQSVDDSISARAACCCWQTSKSTRRECALKLHLSLRKRKVVTNASSDAGVVSNLREDDTVVADGDVLDKDGCGCRCWPTFQICGRRKSTVVATSDLQKQEVAATNGPDLVKEEEVVVVDPDLRKEEGSGCCCGGCGRLPAFQICRKRKLVAVKEEVIVDVPKVEELANDDVTMQEGDSVGCLRAFHICAGRKRVDDNPKTFEKKEAVATDDSSNVDVPDLQKERSGCCSCFKCVPTFQICGRRRRNADSDVPNGCCSCFKCAPSFHICGRRRRNVESDVPNPGREEKVVVGVSDLPEEEVVATDKERHSKSARGGICWPFQICARGWLPRFFLCREKTAVDASNHREEEEKTPPDVGKEEEVVAVIPDPQKESIAVADGIPDHGKEKQMAADDIPVLSTEEKMSAGKEKNLSSGRIQEVRKEEEIVDSGVSDLGEEEGGGCRCFKLGGKEGGRRQRRRSSRPREGGCAFQICGRGWLPTLYICRGREKVSVRIPKLHEEEGLVDNGVSDVHNEAVDAAGVTRVVAATDHPKSTRRCGCWHSKPRRRRAVAVDKDGGNGRCSKSKRRRKQREGKERNR